MTSSVVARRPGGGNPRASKALLYAADSALRVEEAEDCSANCYRSVVPPATVLPVTPRGVIPQQERARLRGASEDLAAAADELQAAVYAAWQAGGSVREIAEELGKSTRTIQDWIARRSDLP